MMTHAEWPHFKPRISDSSSLDRQEKNSSGLVAEGLLAEGLTDWMS